jgi:YD repeat-containing protein
MEQKGLTIAVFLLSFVAFGNVPSEAGTQPNHSANAAAQEQPGSLEQYVEQASEFSSRARANVYFPNPQSIFVGVQFNFVNTGSGSLTFLRRDLVVSGRIPLIAARVYDSSSKGTVDFGPGWRLSATDTLSVTGNKAQLITESGYVVSFVRTAEGAFQLETDYPSDYLGLKKTAPDTIQATLRSGLVKEFTRIEHEFRLTKVSDRNGNEIRLLYKNGLLARMENANHWISFIRNKNGRIAALQDDQKRKVSYAYDGAGLLNQVTDLGGHSWQYAYSEAGTLKTATDPSQRLNFGVTYGDSGRVSRLQLPSGIIQYNYAPANRTTTVIDRKQLTSRFFQNEDGITTKVINALGEETAIGLDPNRNVTSLSRNGSVIETMQYDAQHRILTRHSVTDSGTVDRRYSYDAATGLLAGIQASNGSNQSFTYDGKGNLTSATLSDGVHKFSYSPTGNLAAISIPNLHLNFTADPDGLIASVTDDKNAITSFQYQAGGELAEATFPDHSQAAYTYQPSGLRSKLTYQDGRRVEYGYDPAGNLTETKVFNAKGKQVNGQTLEMNDSYQLVRWIRSDAPVTTFQYDANGNLTEIKRGDSTTSFEYDELNRLTAVITPEGQRLTYTYAPGERSLIEQYEHASVLVADLRDTGFTFTDSLNATASRPLTSPYGTVRFSESLGTFQLANAAGSEIVLPPENIEGALTKLHLTMHLPANTTAQDKQNAFNVPFNTIFMPGEYLTINCCPSCCTNPDQICFVKSCPCKPILPAPTLTTMSPSSAAANNAGFGVILNGTFNDASEQVNITPSGITATAATVNPDGTASTTFQLASSPVAGQYNVSVTDSGGTSNQLTFTLLPVITRISPAQAFLGAAPFTATINGAGFASGATLNAGPNISVSNTSVSSATQITTTFAPTSSTSAAGNQNVTATVNGQTSNNATFTLNARTATLTVNFNNPWVII